MGLEISVLQRWSFRSCLASCHWKTCQLRLSVDGPSSAFFCPRNRPERKNHPAFVETPRTLHVFPKFSPSTPATGGLNRSHTEKRCIYQERRAACRQQTFTRSRAKRLAASPGCATMEWCMTIRTSAGAHLQPRICTSLHREDSNMRFLPEIYPADPCAPEGFANRRRPLRYGFPARFFVKDARLRRPQHAASAAKPTFDRDN